MSLRKKSAQTDRQAGRETDRQTDRHKVLIWYTYTIWGVHSSDTMLHSCPLHIYNRSQILVSKWANMQLGSSSKFSI